MAARRAVALALALAAPAFAQDYPPPAPPDPVEQRPANPWRTLRVCERRACFATAAAALRAARPGDHVVVRGRVDEDVVVRKEGVVLRGGRLRTVRVVADRVAVRGLTADAVIVRGAGDVALRRLAVGGGGVRVRGSAGLAVTDVRVVGARIAFDLRHTPDAVRPRRTMLRRLRATGASVGLLGVGLRHATLAGSRFAYTEAGVWLHASEGVVLAPDNGFDGPPERAVVLTPR